MCEARRDQVLQRVQDWHSMGRLQLMDAVTQTRRIMRSSGGFCKLLMMSNLHSTLKLPLIACMHVCRHNLVEQGVVLEGSV